MPTIRRSRSRRLISAASLVEGRGAPGRRRFPPRAVPCAPARAVAICYPPCGSGRVASGGPVFAYGASEGSRSCVPLRRRERAALQLFGADVAGRQQDRRAIAVTEPTDAV